MSNGNWRSDVAAAGGLGALCVYLVWLGTILALGPAYWGVDPNNVDRQPQAQTDRAKPVAAARDKPPAEAYEAKCPDDEDRQECFMQWRSTWAAEEQARSADGQLWWTRVGTYLVLLTFFVACFAAKYARDAAKATAESAKAAIRTADFANSQLRLSFPSRLVVMRFAVWKYETRFELPDLVPGEALVGRAFVGNAGRENATIIASDCQAHWLEMPPAMNFAYLHEQTANNPLGPTLLIPGQTERWVIDVPKRPDRDCELYIVGRVVYLDALQGRHANLFCRRYDPTAKRFVPVDNPDIQGEY